MTNTKSLPSVDYLRKRLRYEPETGKLFWLDYEGMPKRWRTRYSGKEAFTSNADGYRQGKIDGVRFLAHRVVWAIHHGEWPNDQIDHINGVKDNNRVSNLRVVSNTENHRNKTMRSDNTSGTTGVYWRKSCRKWTASIMVDSRHKYLGYFDTIEEAAAARKEASAKYGFTERHGTRVEEVE